MNNSQNVSVGKPKIGGAIYRAPLGTPLPGNAVDEMNEAFDCLGYCSDAGLTNNNSSDSEDIKAWGGDTVLSVQTSKEDTYNFTLIESLNPIVLKTVYGDSNVTGDLNTGIKVIANSEEQEEYSWIIDMILRGGVLKRIVIPDAKVTNVDEISYVDNEPIGYNTTLSCLPDSTDAQATHYEYIQKPKAVASPDVEPEDGSVELFGTLVSDMQTNVAVADGAITGTLKKLTSGDIVDTWGEGYFVALKFSDLDPKATSVKVGLEPSQSSGLVEIIDDPDKNGVFKVTDKDAQVFKVVSTNGKDTTTDTYTLSGLILEV